MPEFSTEDLFEILNKLTGKGEVDQVIKEILGFLCITFSIDIAVIFEFHTKNNETFLRQKFRWTPISNEINPLTDHLPAEKFFPGWTEKIKNGFIIHNFVKQLPQPQKMFFQSVGDATILIIPICLDEFNYGSFCFSRYEEKLWKEKEIEIFKTIANLIASALYKNKLKEEIHFIRKYQKEHEEHNLELWLFNSLYTGVTNYLFTFKNYMKNINPLALKNYKKFPKLEKKIVDYYLMFEKINNLQKFIELFNLQEKSDLDIISFSRSCLEIVPPLPEGISIVIESQEEKIICQISKVDYLQIIYKIVLNCLNKARKESRIKITIEKKKTEAIIIIIYNGTAFTESNIEELQENYIDFFIVNRTLKKLRKNLIIKNKLEIGTSFSFSVPLGKERGLKLKDKENLYNKGKILVVDDNEELLLYQKKVLKGLGYRVNGTTEPKKALEIFRKNSKSYDLIITDCIMPLMTGFEFIDKIRKINKDVPIILYTAFPAIVEEKQIENVKVINKNIRFSKVLITVKDIINKRTLAM